MSKILQKLLDAPEPMFSVGLAQLEKTTGHSGIDARLIADIIEKSHHIMRQLGLDIKDTTGHELYLSLMSAVKRGEAESLLADYDYVLFMADNKIISFNLIDAIENSHHQLSFEKQTVSHGRRSLRGELVGRYIDHARTDEATTRSIASHIGLLPEADICYNNAKHKHKQTEKNLEESAK